MEVAERQEHRCHRRRLRRRAGGWEEGRTPGFLKGSRRHHRRLTELRRRHSGEARYCACVVGSFALTEPLSPAFLFAPPSPFSISGLRSRAASALVVPALSFGLALGGKKPRLGLLAEERERKIN